MAFGSGGRGRGPAPSRSKPQAPEISASGRSPLPHQAHRAAPSSPSFADTLADAPERVLPALPGTATRTHLTVREVAQRLGVSTATVYALCRRGELGHCRVSNAIRVPEASLADFPFALLPPG